MADFVEVMKACNRMCKSHYNCQRCDMHKLREAHDRMTCEELLMKFPNEVLQVVKVWADSNPEIHYPTWYEWLRDVGVLEEVIDFGKNRIIPIDETWYLGIRDKLFEEIPDNIAKKLELKPKGWVNNG